MSICFSLNETKDFERLSASSLCTGPLIQASLNKEMDKIKESPKAKAASGLPQV